MDIEFHKIGKTLHVKRCKCSRIPYSDTPFSSDRLLFPRDRMLGTGTLCRKCGYPHWVILP